MPEQIASKFAVSVTGCWVWQAAISGGGYGYVKWQHKTQKAMKVIYELLVGPVPQGLQLDHSCRNRACVNPYHLEPVTSRENTMRGKSFIVAKTRQTRCIHGHPFNKANTYIRPNGTRFCRTCNRERMRLTR